MTSLGTSEVVGNALRSSKASLALRHHIVGTVQSSMMTATPPKYNLWHPTRGISFSPSARSPILTPRAARASNEAAAAKPQGQAVQSAPDGPEPSPLYPRLEGLSSTAKNNAPILDKVPSRTETASGNDATAGADEQTASETKVSDDPPVAVLPFKIVDDLFRAAKKAPAGSTGSFWSYSYYRGKTQDGAEQKVRVHYCRSSHTMEKVCKEYFVGEPLLGFDLEWVAEATKRQGLKKNVSLIQLASPSRIGLFHVSLFADKADMVGPSFRAIMEDSKVTKVGVAIKGDATRLRNFLDVDSKGLLELSHLYKLVTYSANGQHSKINKMLVPLAAQVEEYLHLPLFKGQDVRSSDWSQLLNMNQVIYSASDAYAGLQLYATLEHHRKQLDPCPPTPYHAERNLPIRVADGVELGTKDDPDVDAVEEAELEAAPATTPAVTPVKPKKTPSGPKDSRIEIAEDRVACYKKAHPGGFRATVPHLRAYYMWHDQGLEPATIAQLLRDPPLKTATIVGYILSAVQLEKLPVNEERLRLEVAGNTPENTLQARWPRVAAMIVPRR
ncbi:ribonuclease H-like protein [Hypoxylon sp. FL1284]|nr:ribonuclease H-like protein [Hypoxylon sp. FL1284]